MAGDSAILDYCDPAFAAAWAHMHDARPLLGGFIDAAALVTLREDDTARLELTGEGFDGLFGCAPSCKGTDFFMCADRLDRSHLKAACREAALSGQLRHADIGWRLCKERHPESDGDALKTRIGIQRVGTEGDTAILYFAIQDVRKMKFTEHKLSREQYASSLRAIFSEIFIVDLDTGENEPIYLDGRPLADDDGHPTACGFHELSVAVHPDDRQFFWSNSNYTHLGRVLFGESASTSIVFDLRRREGDGAFHWTRVVITRVAAAEDRRAVLVCIRNIDEQKEAQRRERELRSKAELDALTGVFNRGTTEELILATLRARGETDSSLFAIFDVDDFKRINDTYGHLMGDKLLQGIAERIQGICRKQDIVGRIGGDEFVALFSGENLPEAATIEERLTRCMEEMGSFSTELGIDPPITMSVGVVPVSPGEASFQNIAERADELLYEVKGTGKNGYRLYRP